MGGTFGPIHMGHLLLAEWARESAGLDQVLFMPTGISYMKAMHHEQQASKAAQVKEPSPEQRFAMVQMAVEGNPHFEACDVEISRPGYTYTYETLAFLKQNHPNHQYSFILGADCLFTIEKWREPERIFKQAKIIAALRGDDTTEDLKSRMEEKRDELEQRFHGQIMLLPFPALEISSTQIRSRIAKGQSIRYMVPESVRHFLEQERFYQETQDCTIG
jgi:nicotinate-nucleotide adenylyltransferase